MSRSVAELLVFSVLIGLLFRFFGVFVPYVPSLIDLVAVFIAALMAGELHGRRTGQEILTGYAWQVAFAAAAILALVRGVYLAVTIGIGQQGLDAFPGDIIVLLTLATFIGSLLLARLIYRWGVTFGARKSPKRVKLEVFD